VVTAARWCLLALIAAAPVCAQQPFYTDDTDVADFRKWHLEVTNQFSLLQKNAYPNLRQSTNVFHASYGLIKHMEIGIDGPLITLFNAPNEGLEVRPTGWGDLNFSAKWNFREEKDGSHLPAMTVHCALESPTGSVARQLGSGLADFGCGFVTQQHVHPKVIVRTNNNMQFSGNALTGVVGLNATGLVYYGGISITRAMTDKLTLGAEFNGAFASIEELSKTSLQSQAAGKWQFSEKLGLDFGVLLGRYSGSPRLGLQLGMSIDF
jgi:hypothetical protein